MLSFWPKHLSSKQPEEKSHLLKSKHGSVENGEVPFPSHQYKSTSKSQASSHSLTTYSQHTSLAQHLGPSPSLAKAAALSPSSSSALEGQRPTCTGFQQAARTT